MEETSDNRMDQVQVETFEVSVKLRYNIDSSPPWYSCILLGLQHYMTMVGGAISVPLVLASLLCSPGGIQLLPVPELICTVFFVSGIVTLLQSILGTRLPIVQGGSFSYLPPTIIIITQAKWNCPTVNDISNSSLPLNESNEIWKLQAQEIQGSIMTASIFQILLGFTGLVGMMLKLVTPLVIATTISLIGMALFPVAAEKCATNWWMALFSAVLVTVFSQHLRNVSLPLPTVKGRKCTLERSHIFQLFPVLLALILSWLFCFILTVTNAIPNDPKHWAYSTRTDIKSDFLRSSPWFRVPYPFQWGLPTVNSAAAIGMLTGVIAGIIESIGDYYACARISEAPPPPEHAINRGVMMEGIGCFLAGMFGTLNGTTSYSENIGAIGITQVGSRRVIQVCGVCLLLLGLLSKIGAIFVTIPDPVIGGLFIVMCGMIASVGISNLQFCNLNSTRNLFVFGVSLIFGLAVPFHISEHEDSIKTGVPFLDQIFTVLLSTGMFVGGLVSIVLDNTIPGSNTERGIVSWNKTSSIDAEADSKTDKVSLETYDLPFLTKYIRKVQCLRYLPIMPTFTGFPSLIQCKRCFNKEAKKTPAPYLDSKIPVDCIPENTKM